MNLLTARLIILAFFLPIIAIGQSFSNQLAKNYESYKETSIQHRRFKHQDIVPLIESLNSPFVVSQAGTSLEGRVIYQVKIGRGKTNVLLWSQMHGDEPTATMAIMDIFKFFTKNDDLNVYRQSILDNLTLYFLPMLNPDGGEKFKRRTALNVDLNRDALRLQTPEGQLLKKIRMETNADWGFNLHDQSRYYSVGKTNKTATISFLAPAYNEEKGINNIRKRAMQQIGLMNETLQTFMPGNVAKYNDDFEPRAFGDNIQKWGTSTILIESGGYKNDPEKQFIRKMNFLALLSALEQIATKKYASNTIEGYEKIPFNGRHFHELLLRNTTVIKNGTPYILDIAFRRDELQYDKSKSFYYKSYISDIGDLSTFFGYEEIDATGYKVVPGKLYPKTIKSFKKFQKLNLDDLHRQGYVAIKIKNLSKEQRKLNLPIYLLGEPDFYYSAFSLGNNPSFFLEKNGKKDFLIVNGEVMRL